MFQSGLSEVKDGEIKIEDAAAEEVLQMVHYIYTAKLHLRSYDGIPNPSRGGVYQRFELLLVLADKYNIRGLVDYCSMKLADEYILEEFLPSLNIWNSLRLGIFAEDHNAELLMSECAEFIAFKKMEILQNDGMKKMEKSPKFASQIIMKLKIKDSLTNGVMNITIKTMTDRIYSLVVKPTDSIEDVKRMIQVAIFFIDAFSDKIIRMGRKGTQHKCSGSFSTVESWLTRRD